MINMRVEELESKIQSKYDLDNTIAASSLAVISICCISIITICAYWIKSFTISSSFFPDDVIESAPDVTLNSNWPIGKSFYSFQVGYWKIQLVFMENRSWAIETGWTWSGGNSSTKNIWTEIWGDGADAAVKDGAAIVISKCCIVYLSS